jgi:imidazolonepropionase-like amidohydrolase
MTMQIRRRWKVVIGVLGGLVVALAVPALIPPGGHYDPAPYFVAVKQSAALPATQGDTPPAGDLIIRRARIVDANGVRGPTSIRIQAGRITAIGDDIAPGPNQLDAAGATVMPGLIEAHGHLQLTPGGLMRRDDAATSRTLRLQHLRAYLACGITTVFDPAVENVVMVDIRRALQAGHAGPRYLGVGTPLATPGGYMSSLWPPGIARADQVGPHLDAIVRAGGVGIKIAFEPGFVRPVWPMHPPEVERAIVEQAKQRKLPIYVHAERADMYRRGLAVHPHALVHAPIDGTKQLAAEVAAAGAAVVTTLALFDGPSLGLHLERLDEPHVRRAVPAVELESVRDRRQYFDQAFGLLSEVTPFIPGRYRDLLAWWATTDSGLRTAEKQNRERLVGAMQSIRHFKEAGVLLVVGSDSGNWPLFPFYFHGPSTWRELRLLAEAGLSPQEILRAATISPAKLLGLSDQIGTVEVGKIADLVIVRDDPLVDLEKAMRSLQHTVRAGVARTPDGWMASR